MEEKTVLSASRTKDPVRVSPNRLAEALRGDAPVRFGLSRELHSLVPNRLGALVLWTKDPMNMTANTLLFETLDHYVKNHGGVILLNLTVTGLGGTALEPGIPSTSEVRASTEVLFERGLVRPEGTILRFDPLINVLTSNNTSLGNISLSSLKSVLEMFCPMGIKRIKTSLVDVRYAHIPKRFEKLGFTPDLPDAEVFKDFYKKMQNICGRFKTRLDICCHPESLVTEETSGCIDGFLINRLLEDAGASWRVTTIPHNDIGHQRRSCRCTYSRDIGYSAGFQTCFKNHGACFYCYSQKNMKGYAFDEASTRVNKSNHVNRRKSKPGTRAG